MPDNSTNQHYCAPMTAGKITYQHTHAAHRHHLLTNFQKYLLESISWWVDCVSFTPILATLHRQIPCVSLTLKATMAAHTHNVLVHTFRSLLPPGKQRQNTHWRSRSFVQRLGYHTDSSQLPDLTTSHTILPLNCPTYQSATSTAR